MEDRGQRKLDLEQQASSSRGIDLMKFDGRDPITRSDPPEGGYAGGLLNVPVQHEARVAEQVDAGKRRRGRPPRINLVKAPPPPRQRQENDEEDVCFICFDGGDLVLCDRRGCPKAYHPACIKRDESFFRSAAKWNCGWHICSKCQKACHYMCYTCTFSVCKKCVKDADYVNVRANMGFCGICLKTIMLIENVAQEDKEAVQVDFDDKSSWEYLFKLYWLCLKGKLSLALDELINAKNPWIEACNVAPKVEPRHELVSVTHSKRRKPNSQQKHLNKLDSLCNNSDNYKEMFPIGTKWATEELLEFVALMKNGDTSLLSQFDVQTLLLEYIRRNNLRDPQQKSHVVCDSMLLKLFGKERLGHIEMLKLLESHFFIQENSSMGKSTNGGVTHSVSSHMEEGKDCDMMGNYKTRKTCKRNEERRRATNLDEYAAIDFHNINLVYLRRNLAETLIDDVNQIHNKVVGSIARIRISDNEQKQDIYRLVQVVGICKAAKSYQIGTKTTDFMLVILNLDKQEAISIDEISNQDFSEDECKRLRQSMKQGLNKALTVGQIMDKAATFQALRVKEALESEIVRLNHLRDRASEKGQMKELRDCLEKLVLLKSPEEHQRRLQEIPEVHVDPSMNPNYVSTENSALVIKERECVLPQDTSAISNNLGNSAQKTPAAGFLCGRNFCTTLSADKNGTAQFSWRLKSPDIQEAIRDVEEANSLWHYQDPTGKIQGPFSLSQLRKWEATGHFPLDLRIWKNYESRDNSVLLTDALNKRNHKSPTLLTGSSASKELRVAPNDQVQTSNSIQKVPAKTLQFDINLDVHAYADSDGNSFFSKNSSASSASSSSYGCLPVAGDSDRKQSGNLVTGLCKSEGDISSNGKSQINCALSSSMISVDQRENSGAAQTHANKVSSVKNSDDQSNTGFGSLNQEIDFLDLPSSNNPKSSLEDLEAQAAETIQSLASSVLNKGSSRLEWCPATSSSMIGGPQNGTVMVAPSEKPAEHIATTQTSESAEVAHSSDWLAIVADPDESVSDLLAELEAMESMNNGLPSSPTSTFQCDDDNGCSDDHLTKDSQNHSVNNPSKLVSSRIEPPQADVTDEPQMRCSVGGSGKAIEKEPEKEAKLSDDASLNRCLELPFLATKFTGQDSTNISTLDLEPTKANLASERVQGSTDQTSSVTREFSHSSPKPDLGHRNANIYGVSGGNIGPVVGQQQRYNSSSGSSDRLTVQRDRGFHHRESGSGLGREKPWWINSHNHNNNNNNNNNRQWSHGNGSNQANMPKGLRVCKFYESGYCKNGAACSFWHP